MERLTEEKQIGPFASLKDKAEAVPGAFATYDCLYAHMVAVTKLKEYEDTGLEPETVSDLLERFSYFYRTVEGLDIVDPVHFGAFVDRVKHWAQAEKDGRLVVLPCKVGAYVWVDGRKAIVEEFFGYKTERYLQAQFYDNMQYVDIPFKEIGKTVFLTREEAEAALKKREEGIK